MLCESISAVLHSQQPLSQICDSDSASSQSAGQKGLFGGTGRQDRFLNSVVIPQDSTHSQAPHGPGMPSVDNCKVQGSSREKLNTSIVENEPWKEK